MGGANKVYRIYRGRKEHYLLCAGLPSYSNASVNAEDKAYEMLEESFQKLIDKEIGAKLELVGESEEICPDDEFYERAVHRSILPLCFAYYIDRKPWCVFAIAQSGNEFWKKMDAFEEVDARDFAKPAVRIQARYYESTDQLEKLEIEEIGNSGFGFNKGMKRFFMVIFLGYGLYRIFSGYYHLD